MNKEKFLSRKLEELTREAIISSEQEERAKAYFSSSKKNSTSIVTVFTAIGILLVALSIITIFAFNWDNLSKEIKIILAFIPLIITAVMLYITMKKDTNKWKIYTSIFSPIAILATNSLISQIFHIQTEIFEIILLSMVMFLPIVAILRNTLSITVYGIGSIIYITSTYYLQENLLNAILILIPLVGYNIYNYIANKPHKSNIVMWIINIINISILLFQNEVLRPDVILIYSYMIYLMTRKLFVDNKALTKLFNGLLILVFLILSISQELVYFASMLEFNIDTLVLSIIVAALIYMLGMYKNIKDMIIFTGVVLLQYTKMEPQTLFTFINLLVILLGIYYIVNGNKIKSYGTSLGGVAIILLLILFRFVNSDLDFIQKSIMFLVMGTTFIVIANVTKKKLGGK